MPVVRASVQSRDTRFGRLARRPKRRTTVEIGRRSEGQRTTQRRAQRVTIHAHVMRRVNRGESTRDQARIPQTAKLGRAAERPATRISTLPSYVLIRPDLPIFKAWPPRRTLQPDSSHAEIACLPVPIGWGGGTQRGIPQPDLCVQVFNSVFSKITYGVVPYRCRVVITVDTTYSSNIIGLGAHPGVRIDTRCI